MTSGLHTPVLIDRSIDFLFTKSDGIYVDGTVGAGGHAAALCSRLGPGGQLICFDADADAIGIAMERLTGRCATLLFVHQNFNRLREELFSRDITSITGLLLDLGVSSMQLDDGAKGFSFRSDNRLDMRMDRRQQRSAVDVLNTSDELELHRILKTYGEERNAGRIARAIVASRPVETTSRLSEIIEGIIGPRFLVKTLARVFQAIRIEVNDELNVLRRVLNDAVELLVPGGRIVVITYHSLEDRIVKECFRAESAQMRASGHKYIPDEVLKPRLQLLTRKPVIPLASEIAGNPRARSAKLRAAEKRAVETT